jgi:hypothetical protein
MVGIQTLLSRWKMAMDPKDRGMLLKKRKRTWSSTILGVTNGCYTLVCPRPRCGALPSHPFPRVQDTSSSLRLLSILIYPNLLRDLFYWPLAVLVA